MEITAVLRAWFCGPSFLCGDMKGVDAAVSLLPGSSTGVRGCGGKLGRHRSQEIQQKWRMKWSMTWKLDETSLCMGVGA